MFYNLHNVSIIILIVGIDINITIYLLYLINQLVLVFRSWSNSWTWSSFCL